MSRRSGTFCGEPPRCCVFPPGSAAICARRSTVPPEFSPSGAMAVSSVHPGKVPKRSGTFLHQQRRLPVRGGPVRAENQAPRFPFSG
ncbi:MAG: hypothetical protein L6W00_07150 [Lentisphaeria bacterium]|nr:MAG: hypothetical protein L6W00_07150 [Lentisphaeria bacterium]